MAAYEIDKVDIRPGDPIRAADLMAIADAVRRPPGIVRGGPGVDVRVGARGQVQISGLGGKRGASLGLTSTAITARSGATPGAGTVALQALNGAGSIVPLGISVTARNFASAAAGIASGKYCWVEQDDNDNWWIVSVEC